MNLDMRGRWYRWDKRATTNDYIQLDIAKFTRSVDLTQRCFGSWRWTWTSGRKESVTYRVEPGAGVRLMYTVGKQQDFEEKFAAVIDALNVAEGHSSSTLWKDVSDGASYLITSEWSDEQAFTDFIRSDAFRAVTSWGKEQILSGRPQHKIYKQ